MKALGSPLKRSIVPAIVIVALLCTFFILHYHDDIRLRLGKSQHKTKRKAIVSSVQRKDETTSDWIVHMLPDWEPVVYVADRTSDEPADGNSSPIQAFNMPINRGREASVYLTYIIHHYHDLPDYVVFIHGKRYQLHNGGYFLCVSHRSFLNLANLSVQTSPYVVLLAGPCSSHWPFDVFLIILTHVGRCSTHYLSSRI